MSSIKAVAAQLSEEVPKPELARKSVNDHLSLASRHGTTADALFESYKSWPAFAEDSRTAEKINLFLDFFHPYGYGKTASR